MTGWLTGIAITTGCCVPGPIRMFTVPVVTPGCASAAEAAISTAVKTTADAGLNFISVS
ncbi:hypothetical protein N177_3546 [Lutibaculum baratangense AMV1]|uniref:Uncharacterized protein n=1 Tax=Lutibaculum baratangense AMV1 TaxID=631454 RepID=V4TAM0_9HYPH|nr:hypothetical protein N177_3546 [Lutibaculum baratangense AMV1]